LAELLLRVHHDAAVPGDGFFEWLAGDEQEADAVVTGLHRDFVAAVEEHERPGVRAGRRRGVQPADRLSGHFERLGGVAEFAAAPLHWVGQNPRT